MISPMPLAGRHGGDGARLALALGRPVEEILDLSASLNPLAPDPAPVVGRHLASLGRYPDPTPATEALASCAGFDPDRLVLTSGGAEAIALVAAETGEGWVDEPDFSLYRRHLRLVVGAPRWRSNPHNPTGLLAPAAATAGVWDEAFWPLATGTWTRGDAEGGSIVLGSLTKLLACPGLRIGYAYAPTADVAQRLRARQPQWSVNGLAVAALPDLLAHLDLAGWALGVRRLRHDLTAALRFVGLSPTPSEANWVLVKAPGLRDALGSEGICVRDCANFGLEGVVRIAVPDPAGLERLTGGLNAAAHAGWSPPPRPVSVAARSVGATPE